MQLPMDNTHASLRTRNQNNYSLMPIQRSIETTISISKRMIGQQDTYKYAIYFEPTTGMPGNNESDTYAVIYCLGTTFVA